MKNNSKIIISVLLAMLTLIAVTACLAKNEISDPKDAFWSGYDDEPFAKLLEEHKSKANSDVDVDIKEGWGKSDELDEDKDLSKGAKAYTYTYTEEVDGKVFARYYMFMELVDGKLEIAGYYDDVENEEFDDGDGEDLLDSFAGQHDKKSSKKKAAASITVSDANKEYLDYLEIEDMDGYTFRMLLRPGMVSDQVVEEETGDIINDAVYRRNEIVKSLFNIDIVGIESSDNNAGDALNTILAGDDAYDIILPHSRVAFQYAIHNSLVNFNDVKTLHLDKEWWAKDIIDSANVNGHLYVLDGDISTHRLSYAFCMYFNKRIFDELGLEYPYQMALDGTWTFDEFSKLVKQGSRDLNGDGYLNVEVDQYGYYTREWFGPIQALYSGGQRIYTKDARGIPKLSLNSPKTVEIYSKFFNLANTDDVFMQLTPSRLAPEDLFTAGRAMFADMGLGNAKSMRSMNDEFGILPWPKFTKEDEYNTLVNGHASLLIMPVTVEDYDRTGKIIEALCAMGHREVIPAFYDVSLKTKFARDFESEEMMNIIKESIIYDLGYVSGGAFQSTGYNLSHMSYPDFASYYAENESKAQTDLKNFLAAYAGI